MMILVYFFPFWSIYLIAPQYPEGLSMQIWLNKITGQVDIINGLNHYIGMKHIKAEMFPEFKFLVYVLGAFILLGLLVAFIGRRSFLLAYIILFIAFGIAALVDFYMWGYDYGHNLDPTAAIQVPGLSYQPPLIGHKKLLNFDAFSYPDTGGWILIAAVSLFIITWFIDWRRNRKVQVSHVRTNKLSPLAVFSLITFLLVACTPKAEKIQIGKDNCAECRMTIVDPKFGAEIVTKKGRVHKFDDVHCLALFLERRGVELSDIHKTLFVDYNNSNDFVEVKHAEFVISSSLKSPMGGNAAAFKDKASAEKKSSELEGSKVTNWSTLYNVLIK